MSFDHDTMWPLIAGMDSATTTGDCWHCGEYSYHLYQVWGDMDGFGLCERCVDENQHGQGAA